MEGGGCPVGELASGHAPHRRGGGGRYTGRQGPVADRRAAPSRGAHRAMFEQGRGSNRRERCVGRGG
jgi:hypothetical protein